MEKERVKIILNTLISLAMACLFVGLIIAYGKYNFCLKGETTEKGYSIGLVMFFFVIVASYPMFFTFIRRDLKGKMTQLSWLVMHASLFSSTLVFIGIASVGVSLNQRSMMFRAMLFMGITELAFGRCYCYRWHYL